MVDGNNYNNVDQNNYGGDGSAWGGGYGDGGGWGGGGDGGGGGKNFLH